MEHSPQHSGVRKCWGLPPNLLEKVKAIDTTADHLRDVVWWPLLLTYPVSAYIYTCISLCCMWNSDQRALEHGALYKYQPYQTEQWARISGFGMDKCGWMRPCKQIRSKPSAITESSAGDESVLITDFHQTSCCSGGRQPGVTVYLFCRQLC